MNHNRDFGLRPRKETALPPERLYVILRNIYPKEIADETYTHLTDLEPPKGEPKEEKHD